MQQFIAGTVDFAGSDSALKEDEHPKADARCKDGKAIDLPMVTGPLAISYNLPGVDGLVLDAPTIAKIFSGTSRPRAVTCSVRAMSFRPFSGGWPCCSPRRSGSTTRSRT